LIAGCSPLRAQVGLLLFSSFFTLQPSKILWRSIGLFPSFTDGNQGLLKRGLNSDCIISQSVPLPFLQDLVLFLALFLGWHTEIVFWACRLSLLSPTVTSSDPAVPSLSPSHASALLPTPVGAAISLYWACTLTYCDFCLFFSLSLCCFVK